MSWMDWSPRRRTIVAAAVALPLALAGCAGTGTAAPAGSAKQIVVGALYMNEQGFYGGIKKGIQDGAAAANVRLLGNNSASDASKEAQFMSSLIGGGANVIIMSPVSETGSVSVVKQAHDAKIPIICYNTCLTESASKDYVSALVMTDDDAFGRMAGEAAVDHFTKLGVKDPKFGLLQCDSFEQCKRRKAGFLAALKEGLPEATVVADQEAYEADKATSVGTNVLTANPEISALWSANEGGTIGAVQAVRQANQVGKVVVFGSDIDTQLAQFLQDGKVLKATVGQAPQEMGKLAVKLALQVANGQPVDTYKQIVPVTLYSVDDKAAVDNWLTVHADGLP